MNTKNKILIIATFMFSSFVFAVNLFNDPLYPDQWNLNGDGFLEGGDFDIGFEEFKQSNIIETEETVTVIFSNGVDVSHVDIKNSLWVNPDEIPGNNIDDDLNGYVDDVNGINANLLNGELFDITGIGTAVTSIIAAEQDNNAGISGISKTSKIANCKYSTLDVENALFFYEALSNCVDYVLDLKNNKNKIISSVVIDFGLPDSVDFVYDIQLIKPYFEKLKDNGILVIAPASFIVANNMDRHIEFPYGYLLDNVILVGGVDINGYLDSARGENSISTLAPSNWITAASSLGRLESGDNNAGSFEQADIAQEQMTNVSVSSLNFTTGQESWMFEIGEEDSRLELNSVDLSAFKDKEIVITFDGLNATNYAYDIDFFDLEHQRWESLYFFTETGNVWHDISLKILLEERMHQSLSDFRIRIGFQGFANQDAVAYIDHIEVFDALTASTVSKYTSVHGPVMAAAQIAGIVAVLKSSTNYDNWQIRNLITASGELVNGVEVEDDTPEISLSNKVTKLIGDNDNGVLNCINQKVQRRIFPSSEFWVPRVIGKTLIIKGLKIDCADSDGNINIFDSLTGKTYVSSDEGLEFDSFPNDGYNITTLQLEEVGKHILSIVSDSDLVVYASYPYQSPKKEDVVWSELEHGTEFYGNEMPFAIRFGGLERGPTNLLLQFPSNGTLTLGIRTSGTSDDPIDSSGDTKEPAKKERRAINSGNKIDFKKVVEVPPDFDPNFIANGIADEDEEFVSYFPFLFVPTEELYYFDKTNHVYGEEGNRVVVVTFTASTNLGSEFSGKFQFIFFEKNSTFVYSYKDFSDNLISIIRKRGVAIGFDYELLIEDEFENDVSYVFKEDDGTNSIPNLVANEIEIRPYDDTKIDLNKLYSEPDGDTLFFSTDISLEFIKVDRLGILSSELFDELNVGDEVTFHLEVTDGEETRTDQITMRVLAPFNSPPTLEVDVVTLETSEEFSLDLMSYVSDSDGDEVSIVGKNLPYNFEIDEEGNLTALLTKSDYPVLQEEIVVELDDGENLVEKSIAIELNYRNHSPEQTSNLNDVTLYEGETKTIRLDTKFVDIDGDFLSYAVDVSYAAVSTVDDRVILNIFGERVGDELISIFVTDNDGGDIEALLSVRVTLRPVEEPEELEEESSGGGVINLYMFTLLLLAFAFRLSKRKKGHAH